ncbi:MAG: 30S ribosomal protein S12 methylthiotransferase accessory factor YcaO [Rhodocyclaceae bacterium]|nr:30S ribosomal protein S12 methylthiotransferase accessory factor YcaO [Rhodocyclaceae bacterium]
MHHETFITGKDAALETSIATLQHRLAQLGFHVEERSWLNPVAGIWSVHVRDHDCPLLFTNGKGATKLAALASALGEFFERLACNYFWTHYYLGEDVAKRDFVHYPNEQWFALPEDGTWPAGLLSPELQDFYNPERSIDAATLVDLNSGNAARGICALPYLRQRDGATIWFPVNLIGNLYVSNGMSAGNTPAEARTQALSEIFERHIKFRVIAEGLCLPDVPARVIARYPRIAAGITALEAAGFGILVKDASLGGAYPVMNVTLLNPRDQGCYASFGAHPCFEVALERALTELLQGRALDALDGFPEPGFDLDEVGSSPNLEIHFVDSSGILHWNFLGDTPDFAFHDWNFSTPDAATGHDCAWLVERIHAMGHDIHSADFEQLGVYACRILVPGLSEIYPLDDLEWENNSVGNRFRSAILQLPELDDVACAALLATLNDSDSGIDDQRLVSALIGLAADAGTLWEDLRVGELKTLLALAGGLEDGIREGLDWILHFAQINPERRRIYRCIDTLIRLDDVERAAACDDALRQLYGAAVVEQAEALLDGEQRFFAVTAPGLALKGCAMHQQLLAAYDKVHPRAAP